MNEHTFEGEFISTSKKCWFWFAAWGVVVLLTAAANPAYLPGAPFFPIGLLALLPNGGEKAITGWMLQFPVLLGWLFYIAFSAVMLRIRRPKTFFGVYVVFCIVLALNLVGCHRTIETASQIH
jgi:hypothetical protein